jgi:hypothetical protein
MHIDYGIERSATLAEFLDGPIQVLVLNTMFFGPQGYLARKLLRLFNVTLWTYGVFAYFSAL